jgi:ATP-dependent DNA helicase RecG
MLTKVEIEKLLADIENDRVERTVSTTNTDKFAKAVCAFANDLSRKNRPGYLLIGAKDDGSLCGLKVTDELLRNLAGLRSDGNILPQPALMVDKISFSEGDLAIVEVPPSKNTPVKYKGTTYIRIGARKGEANDEEIRILQEKSEIKAPTFDSTPCFHASVDNLDLEFFQNQYLPRFIEKEKLQHENRTAKQQLAALNLYDLKNDCPTNAGVLLISNNTDRVLFGSYIQFVQFAGIERSSKILNERQFRGNIFSILNDLEYLIKYNIQKQRPVFVSVLREEMRINYPYEAMRELVMNMVMHRNYNTNAPAKIYQYADRIELDNPGNLYGKVNPDNFPNENDYRNPIIANAMKVFGYVNQFNIGVNEVQNILLKNKNGYAQFYFDDVSIFKVIVTNADKDNQADGGINVESGSVNEDDGIINLKGGITNGIINDIIKSKNGIVNSDDILNLIEKYGGISTSDIAKYIGKSWRTTMRYLEPLRKNNQIEYRGSKKNGGYWKI